MTHPTLSLKSKRSLSYSVLGLLLTAVGAVFPFPCIGSGDIVVGFWDILFRGVRELVISSSSSWERPFVFLLELINGGHLGGCGPLRLMLVDEAVPVLLVKVEVKAFLSSSSCSGCWPW